VVSVPSVGQGSVEGDLAAHVLVKRVINEHQICKCVEAHPVLHVITLYSQSEICTVKHTRSFMEYETRFYPSLNIGTNM
jgi:hypothetical protein